ncbi:MAG: AAA family ATPase, partial [Bryobacteraceae bacterium]
AAQTAFAIRRTTGKRILLADFDLWGGSMSFFFKLSHWCSLADAIKQFDKRDADWSSLVVNAEGIDVLPAPEQAKDFSIEADRLHDLLEYTRGIYDWIVIDLPSVFDKLSLITLSDTDDAYLVSTSEMPSLHLTRKAVGYLMRLGFGPERFRVLVNRMNKQDGIGGEDMARIFGAPVYRVFPNDYLALHRGLTTGQQVSAKSALGKSIEDFAGVLAGPSKTAPKKPAHAPN